MLVEITDKYANHGPSILSFGFGGGEKFYNADVAGHAAVLLATLVGSFGTDIPGWGAGAYVNAYQKIFGAGKLASWPLPAECKTASAPKASVDYRDEESGIRFMWVQNGAFQQIAGNQNRTNEWAKTLDFVVVQDIWHTPSVDWADIVPVSYTHLDVYKRQLIVVASLLAIVGIFCKRVQLLVGGFQIPNIDMAGPLTPYTVTGWESGMAGAYQGMVYFPTPLEFGVALGVVGLGALLLLAGLKFLPLKPAE